MSGTWEAMLDDEVRRSPLPITCGAVLDEHGTHKPCVRQFPIVHQLHATEDGALWTS